MRLINADTLMREFAEFVRESNNSDFAKVPTWNDAVSLLGSAPTIDPVKHGKWIWQDSPVFGNPYGSYMCPLCQNTMPHKTNYCPNCGAKMDGGKE